MGAKGSRMRTGGQLLVDALRIHGVDAAFCVPGESYLPVLDALYDHSESIRLIVCRQEGGAAFMAEAYGKLTGRPGICFVTRGPGATNASIGVHTAFQDSTPMILFVGQVGRGTVEREGFQEIDYRRMFGPLAKWVAQIDEPGRIPEMLSHAFHLAVSGRPGPVVLALPEDMLASRADVADTGPYRRVAAHPGLEDMETLRGLLEASIRPLMILGGGGWSEAACADIRTFAETNNLPVACAFRCQDYFDNNHPNYIGDVGIGLNPALAERIRQADVLLAVGTRLEEVVTDGYRLIDIPRPRQTLIHVHPGAEELGRVYQARLPIHAGMPEFASALKRLSPLDASARRGWTEAGRADYLANQQSPPGSWRLDLAEVMAFLRRRLPAETLLTNGAGNYTAWVHRFYAYPRYRTQLAPANGAMGYGVPAAVAAKVVHPQRPVVCFSGDGCFLMTGQELATAVHYRLSIIFLVINNGMYGTIRMHQERRYPGRVSGTSLTNPDFAALARAYGAFGERVESTEDFEGAFERAWSAAGPALLELCTDPEAITPRATLSGIRGAG